jgi:hypothetical protein
MELIEYCGHNFTIMCGIKEYEDSFRRILGVADNKENVKKMIIDFTKLYEDNYETSKIEVHYFVTKTININEAVPLQHKPNIRIDLLLDRVPYTDDKGVWKFKEYMVSKDDLEPCLWEETVKRG